MAIFAATAASQERSTSSASASIIDTCFASPPPADGRPQDGLVALPIGTMFVDGQTRTVDELLCIVPVSSDTPEADWFRIDRKTRQITKIYSGIQVEGLLPSPYGQYLAVQLSAEGHPWIEILDLPALMRSNTYKILDEVGGYPGTVSIGKWKGLDFSIKSDQLLSDPTGRHLDLLSTREETFLWNVETGAIVAQSSSLQDPVRYYCDKIAALRAEGRTGANWEWESAIEALGALKKESGAACLESALRAETNEGVRVDIREALEEIARAAALKNDCLNGSRNPSNSNEIVAEPIRTLFSRGQSIAIDNVLCVANPPDDREGSTWLRLDRKTPDLRVEFLAGLAGKVERMAASPDGKYLAVQYGYVDIVDLPMLLTARRYKSIRRIAGSIKEWNGAVLEVTSDTLLSHAPIEVGDESHMLPLLAKESFVWDSRAETVTPVWSALQNPVRYYCEALSSPETESRRIASTGLRLLRNKDAVTCIEQALGRETDETLRRELRETIAATTKP
jgi:hypothetical protein